MTFIQAIILGIVQGLTEFLPVSSSGHLTLVQALLGLENLQAYIAFDLICHLGTLLAIFCVFYQPIAHILTRERTLLFQIGLGTLPLFPLVLAIKPIKSLFNQPEYLGFFFIFTAFLLWCGLRYGKSSPNTAQDTALELKPKRGRWRDALFIGTFQALAILPGVSRSGSTVSAARLLGWSYEEALRFSFLLAIPAILGGVAIEALQLLWKSESGAAPLGLGPYLAGFISSFIVGWWALSWLFKLAAKNKFIYFVWYCLILGVATLLYFHV